MSVVAKTQSTAGITNTRDTSYNITDEYNKLLKTIPELKKVTGEIPESVYAKKNMAYCKTGNRNLMVDAFYPKQKIKQKRTAIILLHGGGWRTGDKKMMHPLAQQLSAMNYVCFTPEYRLSTEALYPAAIYDIKAAIKWVRLHAGDYNIDTNKIVIAGHSAGGELAAFMGATNNHPSFENNICNSRSSSKVNAVIDMDGILAFIHPESGEGDDSKRISAATNWFGYSKTENPGLWKQASPLTHAGSHTPPTLFINSSADRMHAGREDFIKMLDQYHIYTEIKTFTGAPHSFILFNPWFDTTLITIDNFLKTVFNEQHLSAIITVAKDGSGNYKTIQDALNSIPFNNNKPVNILIKNGIYKEKLILDSTKNFVTLVGENKFNTIITYDDHTGKISPAGDTINTFTSQSFLIRANDFMAENVTFDNNAGFSGGQAVAVQASGDRLVFRNCCFTGNQDVLFTPPAFSRQYYENCYIEGTTDFIFGAATVWFEKCHIHSKKNSHVTAASTPVEKNFGYIFNDCVLTGDTTLKNVSLGRPWRPYAAVVFMHSYIGNHIKPEGWSNWNNTENYKTTRYAEYKNYGPSANVIERVPWSKQLTDEEVKAFTIKNVFGNWDPKK